MGWSLRYRCCDGYRIANVVIVALIRVVAFLCSLLGCYRGCCCVAVVDAVTLLLLWMLLRRCCCGCCYTAVVDANTLLLL